MLPKYTQQTIRKSNHTLLEIMVAAFLLFFSSLLFASERLDTQHDLSQDSLLEEASNNSRDNTNWIINAYIIVPIKWVDNAITEAFSIFIPIKGAAAFEINDPPKKPIQEEVMEALIGSNENLNKHKDVVADALKEAQKGLTFQNELMQAQLTNPDFQDVIRKNQEMLAGINQQFIQAIQHENPSLLLYQYSREIKDFYARKPEQLKALFTKIINSDLADSLKIKASQMLDMLNSGASSLNYYQMVDLFASVIKNGFEVYVICEMGCGVVGGFATAVSTGGAAVLLGINAGIVECEPICSALSSIYAARGGINAKSDNMYFRKGSINTEKAERIINPSKAESKIWKSFENYKKDIKTNGQSDNKKKNTINGITDTMI